ncbi:MAG: hypothetical protein PHI85_02225 [Victivallaceae bacterium]|nr:hypothetical protein [Victivallaceae bacterium]
MRYVARVRGIAAKNWKLRPVLNAGKLCEFTGPDKLKVDFYGVAANGFQEIDGLPAKSRAHVAADHISGSLETETVLPLGPELKVRRTIELSGGMASVTVDISGGVVRSLELDRFVLAGKWKEMRVFDGAAFKTSDISVPGKKVFQLPLCAITFEAADGRRFEFGCADDFWRYSAPEKLGGGRAELTVEIKSGSIEISRKLFHFPDEAVLQNRPWRFSWYFAWPNRADEPAPAEATTIDMAAMALPESGLTAAENGVRLAAPCLLSASCRKQLRRDIRAAAGNLRIVNLNPGLCFDPAHLERPARGSLCHWDFLELFALRLWAGRRTAENGAECRLEFAPDAPAANLLAAEALCSPHTPEVTVGDFER